MAERTMSDGASGMDGARSWSGLLAETRQALSTLRVEELEELSIRAKKMFDLAAGPMPKQGGVLSGSELGKTMREHRLLGDLLLATDENLQVLRRLQCRLHTRRDADEGNARWAR